MLGVYVNPDDIQKELATTGRLALSAFGITTSPDELKDFLAKSELLDPIQRDSLLTSLAVDHQLLTLPPALADGYLASVLSDWLRRKLIAAKLSFTFETVMSSKDKVALLDLAKAHGFRTYLYYIATEDPAINVSRVHNRVVLGGHTVPEDKILARYARSLDLLFDAIRKTDRAYLFDNSGSQPLLLAEITGGDELILRTEAVPSWLQDAVLSKLPP
ncbi:zeta toxin family protein [Caulifigura coniformis]|uniref:zeta toxin family protein n=1 Tax=Caulifigura coniformis TaxID=2527983 RepID=UPI001E568B61|nr:zeta toxin family protein [Caulifigura coniformis]